MRICVMGSSILVAFLIQELRKEGHQIVHVASEPGGYASPGLGEEGVEKVVSDGPTLDILRHASIESADAFLALSNDDNRNAMAAQIAQRLFNIPKVVCLIQEPERAEVYERLGLTPVCPTSVAAEVIQEVLRR